MTDQLDELTVEQAITALPNHSEIHSFTEGGIGYNLTRERVIERLKEAAYIYWTSLPAATALGHQLVLVEPSGHRRFLDVRRPESAWERRSRQTDA